MKSKADVVAKYLEGGVTAEDNKGSFLRSPGWHLISPWGRCHMMAPCSALSAPVDRGSFWRVASYVENARCSVAHPDVTNSGRIPVGRILQYPQSLRMLKGTGREL